MSEEKKARVLGYAGAVAIVATAVLVRTGMDAIVEGRRQTATAHLHRSKDLNRTRCKDARAGIYDAKAINQVEIDCRPAGCGI